MKLLAFHNDSKIKDKYIARVRAHAAADEIVSGQYWQRGKGCAVGCTIHGDSHAKYETELGIPQVLARLEDRLFEGMFRGDPALAKTWPERFLNAPKVGADLSMIWPQFAHWMLVDPEFGVIRFAKKRRIKRPSKKYQNSTHAGLAAISQAGMNGAPPPTPPPPTPPTPPPPTPPREQNTSPEWRIN